MLRTLVVASLLVLSAPSHLLAQSKWGVAVSWTPEWKSGGPFGDALEGEGTTVDFSGSDFSIGIARGSDAGGDWGVSFIRQTWDDGSTLDETQVECNTFVSGCFTFGEKSTSQNVKYNAFYIHKFAPFVTIKDRVQIGMNFGGGIGSFSGTFIQEQYDISTRFVPGPGGGTIVGQQEVTVSEVEPKEVLFAPWPIAKIQVAAAVRVAPGVKVRVAGGLDFPGTSVFGLTGVYLFGN